MEAIQTVASEVIVNVVVSVIGLLAAYAIYGVRKLTERAKEQTAQLKDKNVRQLLNNALNDVENITGITVSAIEQTTAKALREAIKDGKASRDELLALATLAKKEITASIKPEAQRIITENLCDFDTYITKLIEEKVLALKAAEQ